MGRHCPGAWSSSRENLPADVAVAGSLLRNPLADPYPLSAATCFGDRDGHRADAGLVQSAFQRGGLGRCGEPCGCRKLGSAADLLVFV